jgi:hypothetical protein
MWNIKKAQSEEQSGSSSSSKQPSFLMNPQEITKNELMTKLKFFGAFIATIVVVPKLLRGVGLLEPLDIPLTRR